MRNSARVIFLTTTISCISLFGQGKGGGGGGGTAPPGPGTGTGTSTPSPTNNIPPINTTPNNTQNTAPTYSRPLYVSGKVVMDDGTPPPSSVTIVRVCNGISRAMGYTTSSGDFSFDMNHADSTFQDASTPGLASIGGDPTRTNASLDDPLANMRTNMPNTGGFGSGMGNSTSLLGCELRAQLSGYRSSAIQLAQRRSMDDPDVGVIILHRMSRDEGSTVSMTSMMAPKDAKKAFEKGMEALKKKKMEDAEKNFQKAVDAYPKYADAWFHLGALQMDQKNTEAARKSFAQAIAADPKLVTPYVDLAILDAREAKWKEVAENAGKAIRLDPVDFPIAFYFDALANYNLQNYQAAEKSARQVQRLDSQHRYPLADRILASVLADRKDYSGAAEQMRNYLKFNATAKDADEVRGQLQSIEKMMAEQKAQ